MDSPVGIYLSVPFCKAKCSFCNFASDAFGSARMEAYVERLCGEIRGSRPAAKHMGARLERAADSIYFGGGTPSLLSAAQFRTIFAALREQFEVDADAEVTLECAPGQLAPETLEELLRQGVNRVSLGVQSFVDREAQAVGRLHTAAMCEAEIARLRAAGMREIGIDLIAGLPHQGEASWRESVERAVASGVTHVSVYMLEVDEESRLGREVLAGGVRYGAREVPSEDEMAAWYEAGCEMLDTAGVRQYEISNFAREGHESRHNVKYWRRLPYIGFGLDAHSMLPLHEGAVRFQNTDDLDVYMGDVASAGPLGTLQRVTAKPEAQFIGREAAFEESLFLGLRLNEGVRLDALRESFGGVLVASVMPGVEEAREAGLLVIDGERVRLTAKGRMASNEVFSRLLVPALA
ncbi:radical SAM family heme chaperone HemW [Edaphobacter aggregans]|uniref:radical SAM family heme chaperone HemW n=1 Tax=Edaphobacter aggregans TaxID=570835 RepID=UPI0012F729D8|nr:radical SAM family heme chaperone HemW [Edaphobacter aggregans]